MYFLSPAEIDRLKARRQQAAFAPACQAIIQQATDAIEHPLDIPREGAGWFHNYFCPDHAVALTYDVHQPTVHRCPVDGRCYEGAIYDSAWRYKTQCIIVDGLYASALAWLLTGEGHYLSHAIDVLTAYAERYAGYEPHGEYAGKGRCMGQSLDEAVWAIPLAWAYDIVQETQTAAWRASIRDRLLRPIADHLTGQAWHTIHNIECWHLAGLASLAMVLDEPDYLAPVLDQSTGLPGQCAQGIREDGWWYEGSPTYHFYTVNAILSLLLALRYRYPEYLQQPRIKAMLDAPLAAARNDLSIPAFNDGWFDVAQPGYLAGVAKFYDIAWALWEDPSYKILLNRIRATSGGPNTVEALLFGPDSLHEPEHAALGNCVQPASGYAFFRRNTDDRTQWLSYKFGPHGGGHGHMDKLSLDLHAFGERLSPDLGTPGYGIPLHHLWYRHTLSHNTVLIDQTAQPEGEGMLFHFADGTSDGFAVADAGVSWGDDVAEPYRGVSFRRVILWKTTGAPYFIDCVLVNTPTPRDIDLAWHHRGTLAMSELQPAIDWVPSNDTYRLLHDVQQTQNRNWMAAWHLGDTGTQYWALEQEGATLYTATVPANPAAETMSLLLRRVHAAEAVYAAVVEPYSGQGSIRTVQWQQCYLTRDGHITVQVEGSDWSDRWTISYNKPFIDSGVDGNSEAHRYHYTLPQSLIVDRNS